MCNKKFICYGVVLMFAMSSMLSFSMNLVRFYDTLLRPEKMEDSRFQWTAFTETGFSSKSFDASGCVSNPLRIWTKDQNAIKMLDGAEADTPIGQKRIQVGANDDGTRGHLCVCGDLDFNVAAQFYGWYYFKEYFSLSFYLPVYSVQLKNVSWKDQTKSLTDDDFRVKRYITDDFCKNVLELGGLYLGSWKRTGVGDLTLAFEWMRDFEQARPFLKNVRLQGLLGATLPTGKRADEDKIFAFPFGADGSTGTFIGAGIDLTFGKYFKGGLNVNLLHLFGNSKCRRIKTADCQTDLLFLQKANTYKDFGLTQRFNLYAQLFRVFGGASLKVAYQFLRHGDDIVSLQNGVFSDKMANTAESLQEWTIHSFIFDLSYDFFRSEDDYNDHRVHPYISVFTRLPFNGMRSAMAKTIGVTLSIDF